ncbi:MULTISPECIES: ATPase domain-containing protein [Metallosphaera]|nr:MULTISPECIES: ATPase domain-containing protein [Metallosphaera]AKV74340.1 flagellar accessory protein FlaH [Metallosphaera sedula]AKV76579.1 flagellar accessory protein FlaH [Metallosphaera sedula]AKV78831.1 flagellar accessory protein FlaH [Metallosphaera sedula]AKV81076.1 flagellar accessory protein FlaH [Metallosphaera sedula]AKV83314.1 flagellar accessory protein FlaH [Metallosphaera sedula]
MEGYPMIIPTTNEELDRRLGGIPFPALIMIEGDHGTGKSVMGAQFVYGLLSAGKSGYIITTEQSTYGYLKKMREVKIDLIPFFLRGKLGMAPLNTSRFSWNSSLAKKLLYFILEFIRRVKDFVLIDSFTVISTFARGEDLMEFLKGLRVAVSNGKEIIITVHPNAFSEDMVTRVRSEADVYFRTSSASIGNRRVKVIEKIKTSESTFGSDSISFDVDPSLGIKVVPLTLSRA